MLKRFVADDSGQDLVEYALLSGIIGIAGALVLPAISDAMHNAYQNWQAGALDAWEPCAPGGCP